VKVNLGEHLESMLINGKIWGTYTVKCNPSISEDVRNKAGELAERYKKYLDGLK
jgi:hypothetical protein